MTEPKRYDSIKIDKKPWLILGGLLSISLLLLATALPKAALACGDGPIHA